MGVLKDVESHPADGFFIKILIIFIKLLRMLYSRFNLFLYNNLMNNKEVIINEQAKSFV